MAIVREIETRDYVSKSNLPQSDFVINPYGGCLHGCKYCYARFMKRFNKHEEDWGEYLDVKRCRVPIIRPQLEGADVTLCSVTDPYNPAEEKYGLTRMVLAQLANVNCNLYVLTKSKLILRDLNLLKKQKNLVVAISLNTLDESFRADMDRASTVQERLDTIRTLHSEGIYTVLFCSPMFPGITNYREMIDATREFVCEYWFEDLNLRGEYRPVILSYIREKYPHLVRMYNSIYTLKDTTYWRNVELAFSTYCESQGITYLSAFSHSTLVAKRKEGQKWR